MKAGDKTMASNEQYVRVQIQVSAQAQSKATINNGQDRDSEPRTLKLRDLQKVPRMMSLFQIHCDNEHSSENLDFRDKVLELQEKIKKELGLPENKLLKEEEIIQKFQSNIKEIFNIFLAENAPKQIILSPSILKKIRTENELYCAKGNGFTMDTFASAVMEVNILLETDPIPRFTKSMVYKKANHENEAIDKLSLSLTTYLDKNKGDEFLTSPSGCFACCRLDKHGIFMNFKKLNQSLVNFSQQKNMDIKPIVSAIRETLATHRTLIGDTKELKKSKNEYTLVLYAAIQDLTALPHMPTSKNISFSKGKLIVIATPTLTPKGPNVSEPIVSEPIVLEPKGRQLIL